MDGFTIVDGVVAFVIFLSAILAYARGFVREAMAIVGWIAAAILAYYFAPSAEPLMAEIPVVGEYMQDSCELAVIAAFAGVFAIALVVVSIFTPLFAAVVQRSALGGVDQGLGFLFGVARGLLLVAVALVIYDRVIFPDGAQAAAGIEIVDNSRTAQIFNTVTENLNDQ
ncbi:MAG: CvpA family protein, partial [Pseudomonadota bacterium]